ncbi:MAG: DUF4320 family protein [Eubacteriales bacterium]|nr:DUF4320 family protein [Eubacteriales bacterium]
MDKLKKLLKDKRGSLYFELLVFFLVVTVWIMTSINFYNAVINYQNINYMAKSLAKTIELEGAVTGEVYDKMEALNENFNIDADMKITNIRYYDSFSKTIQFRDPFTVTVSDTFRLEVLSPLFSDPVYLDIPLSASITGMSEVYWKD